MEGARCRSSLYFDDSEQRQIRALQHDRVSMPTQSMMSRGRYSEPGCLLKLKLQHEREAAPR